MSEYTPKRFPVYTVDGQGRIREYQGIDAWNILRGPDERRIFKKDMPKDCVIHESFCDYDV